MTETKSIAPETLDQAHAEALVEHQLWHRNLDGVREEYRRWLLADLHAVIRSRRDAYGPGYDGYRKAVARDELHARALVDAERRVTVLATNDQVLGAIAEAAKTLDQGRASLSHRAILNELHGRAVAAGFHSVTVTGDAEGRMVTTFDPPRPEIRITARKARRLLREVVADAGRGRHVAEPGRYVRKGRLICLIAFVLHRAGMTVVEVAELDAWSPNEIERAQLPARVRMSGQARRVLYVAQDSQDWQNSWGEALDAALAVRPYARQQLAGAA